MMPTPPERPPDDRTSRKYADYAPLETGKPQHHGCLQLWLAAIGVVAAFAFFQFLFISTQLPPNVSPMLINILLLNLAAEVACVIAIYRWKRWGVYGLGVVLCISFVLRLLLRVASGQSVLSIAFAAGMIYYFVRPNWDFYE